MKRILLFVLLLLCLIPVVLADGPDVFVAEGAEGVPQKVIDQIVADYPDAGAITIMALHTATPSAAPDVAPDAAPALPLWLWALGCAILLVGVAGLLLIRRRRLPT